MNPTYGRVSFMQPFPEYLKARFKTQSEAAEFFDVSPALISHWYTGRRKPSPKKAAEIIERVARVDPGVITYESIYGPGKQCGERPQ